MRFEVKQTNPQKPAPKAFITYERFLYLSDDDDGVEIDLIDGDITHMTRSEVVEAWKSDFLDAMDMEGRSITLTFD